MKEDYKVHREQKCVLSNSGYGINASLYESAYTIGIVRSRALGYESVHSNSIVWSRALGYESAERKRANVF